MNFKQFHESKNLFIQKLTGVTINSSGEIVSDVNYDTYIAEVSNGEAYTVSNVTGTQVYGFFTTKPTLGTITYNSSRTIFSTPSQTLTVPTGENIKYIGVRYNTGVSNAMFNEGSQPLPYEPYSSEVWHDTPHYIHNTSTDTITTLPAVLYPNAVTATVGLKGNMEQNGTPAPDNPIQPQECGDMSSNLFDLTAYYAKDSGVSNIVTTQNSITYNVSRAYCAIRYKFSIAQNETMKLSLGSATGNGRLEIRYYNTQAGQQVGDTLTMMQNERITLTGSSEYDSVNIYISNGTTIGTMSFSDIMINIGTTFLPFEPYGQYKIPISSANTTTPVFLGEVESIRRIRKFVLTGEEYWTLQSINSYGIANLWTELPAKFRNQGLGLSTHLTLQTTMIANTKSEGFYLTSSEVLYIRINATRVSTVTDFKAYLSAQYAAGTPVTVWYVLAEPETGIVNEPLHKIGAYADEVSGISIPTIAGANTLSVGTTLQPSEVTVNYKGWHPVADVHEADNGAWT